MTGNIVSGLLLALFMSNAGGLWDNSKKYIEAGHEGGKGSDAHKSAVVGDTVGDPCKDTAGPSINTQITVVSLVASLCAALLPYIHFFRHWCLFPGSQQLVLREPHLYQNREESERVSKLKGYWLFRNLKTNRDLGRRPVRFT